MGRFGHSRLCPRNRGRANELSTRYSKRTAKSMNRKERRVALDSAIAATGSKDLVRGRGHKFDEDIELPLVVTDEVETVTKSSVAKAFLSAIGVWDDIDRVKKRARKIRVGRTGALGGGPLLVC